MRFVARPRGAVADITIVGAYALEVTAWIMPGLPRSTIRGGRWAGVDVISKSGTFSAPTLSGFVLLSTRYPVLVVLRKSHDDVSAPWRRAALACMAVVVMLIGSSASTAFCWSASCNESR